MSAEKTRTDRLLETWGRATAHPVPAFVPDPRRRRRRWLRAVALAGTVALMLVALAVGAVLLSGSSPAPMPTPAPLNSSGPLVGFKRFEAPGISFDYPADWTDQTDTVLYPSFPQRRTVAVLGQGVTICHQTLSRATPVPGSCETDPSAPGSLILTVGEETHPLPGVPLNGTQTTIAGHSVWEIGSATAPAPQTPASLEWVIQAPDSGLYVVQMESPRADLDARRADVVGLLASLRLSAWDVQPTMIAGHVHLSMADGFSFDYPADWTLYYPNDLSMMDHAVVTVASNPVLPPCSSDSCQRFATPPNTVAVEFRIGSGLQAPDWSKAKARLGGQPAFDFGAWGPDNATKAEVGHSWGARLTGRDVLGVYVSIRGPNIPDLQAASDEVLRSLVITPGPSSTP